MIPAVAEHAAELESICQRYSVARLDLFGSAATGKYRPEDSDLDFLVEFQELPAGGHASVYFGLLKSLERLFFGRPVDLVVESAIKNPYFRESVEETRVMIYAA